MSENHKSKIDGEKKVVVDTVIDQKGLVNICFLQVNLALLFWH